MWLVPTNPAPAVPPAASPERICPSARQDNIADTGRSAQYRAISRLLSPRLCALQRGRRPGHDWHCTPYMYGVRSYIRAWLAPVLPAREGHPAPLAAGLSQCPSAHGIVGRRAVPEPQHSETRLSAVRARANTTQPAPPLSSPVRGCCCCWGWLLLSASCQSPSSLFRHALARCSRWERERGKGEGGPRWAAAARPAGAGNSHDAGTLCLPVWPLSHIPQSTVKLRTRLEESHDPAAALDGRWLLRKSPCCKLAGPRLSMCSAGAGKAGRRWSPARAASAIIDGRRARRRLLAVADWPRATAPPPSPSDCWNVCIGASKSPSPQCPLPPGQGFMCVTGSGPSPRAGRPLVVIYQCHGAIHCLAAVRQPGRPRDFTYKSSLGPQADALRPPAILH